MQRVSSLGFTVVFDFHADAATLIATHPSRRQRIRLDGPGNDRVALLRRFLELIEPAGSESRSHA